MIDVGGSTDRVKTEPALLPTTSPRLFNAAPYRWPRLVSVYIGSAWARPHPGRIRRRVPGIARGGIGVGGARPRLFLPEGIAGCGEIGSPGVGIVAVMARCQCQAGRPRRAPRARRSQSQLQRLRLRFGVGLRIESTEIPASSSQEDDLREPIVIGERDGRRGHLEDLLAETSREDLGHGR